MRLSRLDLTRYGKFTDFSIDFGAAEAGRPDLHIIYGPNEAGKSTSFAAYLDLLFGIEQRTRYAFLHPYASMRVGALLELEDGSKELVRIKRPANSLLDGNDQVLAESIVFGGLGSIDREAYRTMFSLDDDSLEAGGESILASKGDLGQLLFSASAGLGHLSQSLEQLRAEADGFYRYRARTGELADLKARLAKLKEQRETIDTLANDYVRLVELRDAALAQYEEAFLARSEVQSRIDEIGRCVRAIPRLAELFQRRDMLASLAGLPQPPVHWTAELPRLRKTEIELATKREAVAAEIEALSGELAAIVVDEEALALSGRLEHFGDMRARHVTAAKDLPERRLRLSELERQIVTIVRSLGKEGEAMPASLLLDAPTVGVLRDLIEKRSGIDAASEAAKVEHAEAERRHAAAIRLAAEAGVEVGSAAGTSAPMIALTSALASARANDHQARRRLAERSRTAHGDAVAERLLALRPWSGDLASLASMVVPLPFEMEAWTARLAQAEKGVAEQAREVVRLQAEGRRLRAELEAVSRTTGVVTDQEAAAARAERENAWAVHRNLLDKTTADAFEALLRQDDIVTNTRLGKAGEVERVNQAAKALALVDVALAERHEAKAAAEAELQATKAEIAAMLTAMSAALPPDIGLDRLRSWLHQREQVLETARLLRQAEREIREADEEGSGLRDQLLAALAAAGIVPPPDGSADMLIAAAQATLDGESERASLRARMDDSQRALEARAGILARADAAEAGWSAAVTRACEHTWLAGRATDFAGLREILARIGELEPALRERAGLADRIAKMEQDQALFAGEVAAAAARLDLHPEAAPLDLYRDLASRVELAKANADLSVDRRKRLEDAERRSDEIDVVATLNARLGGEMTALFGVDTLGEVAEQLQRVERRADLQLQTEKLEREILDVMGVQSIAEVEFRLESVDRPTLERELAELKTRFADLDQRTRELFTAHSRAVERVEAVGGDDAVARIEQQRRLVLLEIEEKARGYFRLRAGTAAAEAALRTYRDRHRSAMMARASSAFATISRGAYGGLATQPDRDGEILIAKAADGTSKVASDLSKGTRFQLYLALRVAGYLEFAQARRPVPFVADDIMETFDDFRAEEAFRLFGEMATVGQVIYLTHHRHLCGIAQRVCPGARIHQLPHVADGYVPAT